MDHNMYTEIYINVMSILINQHNSQSIALRALQNPQVPMAPFQIMISEHFPGFYYEHFLHIFMLSPHFVSLAMIWGPNF